jgi:hypothetical protein
MATSLEGVDSCTSDVRALDVTGSSLRMRVVGLGALPPTRRRLDERCNPSQHLAHTRRPAYPLATPALDIECNLQGIDGHLTIPVHTDDADRYLSRPVLHEERACTSFVTAASRSGVGRG